MIIAIDGPAGSGKSAVGRRVADALGLPFVDSGLMYRAVGLLALEHGVALDDAGALARLAGATTIRIEGRCVRADGHDYTADVYRPELSAAASMVAQVPGVRFAVVTQLRSLAPSGVVMAGRDIGTVVFPAARWKFYLTASAEERARRRAAQMAERGEHADPVQLRVEVEERDRRDADRAVAPMRPAGDAVVLETDGMDLPAVVAEVLRRVGGGTPPDPAAHVPRAERGPDS
ncbi:MAG TPA: (d)CMP kinase [Candidatus Dormibacteraeota bacterium]|nr:(d)CMP kinase [Candidatus Dormibacteraeota bacterium]